MGSYSGQCISNRDSIEVADQGREVMHTDSDSRRTEPCLSADSNTTPARSLAHALTLATQIKFHGPINFPSRRFARALARSFARTAASGSSESVRGRFIRLGNDDGERASERQRFPSLPPLQLQPPAHRRIWSYINEKAINKERPKIEFVERTKRERRGEGREFIIFA